MFPLRLLLQHSIIQHRQAAEAARSARAGIQAGGRLRHNRIERAEITTTQPDGKRSNAPQIDQPRHRSCKAVKPGMGRTQYITAPNYKQQIFNSIRSEQIADAFVIVLPTSSSVALVASL